MASLKYWNHDYDEVKEDDARFLESNQNSKPKPSEDVEVSKFTRRDYLGIVVLYNLSITLG